MAVLDWLINEIGESEPCGRVAEISPSGDYYRLYHFLSDLERVFQREPNDRVRLAMVRGLVRQLLTSSYWLQDAISPPDPQTGWSLTKLYDEPFFPWTLQNSAWSPGLPSPIHNHGTWGVVAVISGQEHNTFWRQVSPGSAEVEKVGECILNAGDVISFLPETIHSIKVLGDRPAITMKVYGKMTAEVLYFQHNPADLAAQDAAADLAWRNLDIPISTAEGFLL
jgi:predicted metal-dependent enzyme (double-stranded beta helix superfamily)